MINRRQESGYILLVVVMLLGILAIAGLATTDVNVTEQRMTVNASEKATSFECSETLRMTLQDNFETYIRQAEWPTSAGGTADNNLFSGLETGGLKLKVLKSDEVETADPRHYFTNEITFLDSEGNEISESNHRPVQLRKDAQLVDEDGNVYAEIAIFRQEPKPLAGYGLSQNSGYSTPGFSAKQSLEYYFQFRSTSGAACAKNAITVTESDFRYVDVGQL